MTNVPKFEEWVRSLEATRAAGDLPGQIEALTRMGALTSQCGDFPDALNFLHEAESLCAGADHWSALSAIYGQIAIACAMSGNTEAGTRYSSLSVEAAQKSGIPRELAYAKNSLGCDCSDAGDFEAALELFARAIEHAEAEPERAWRTHFRAGTYTDTAQAMLRAGPLASPTPRSPTSS